ncbi:DNA-processing protein DprA [Curvivirga aplysinae]|uniref:DNA-processing protein DprA n=1 Tax=Curvivirga aplysinae TaxID=2529852 RepID=UPI0012BBE5C2|nr:DNA-processing protein DprA [Curvivirga aplysinae]MTI10317.1 DNA-protecting protein DprA [Curvivirga aplysinae]
MNNITTNLSHEEKLSRLRLIRSENIGPITFRHLIARYGTAKEALRAIPDIAKQGGRKKPFKLFPLSAAEKEWYQLDKLGGQFVFLDSAEYSFSLSHAETAPPVLSVMGQPHLLNERIIGIVGGRNASLNGKKLAHRFAEVLGAEGLTIASGMARGIDTAAHEGSIKSGSIAVSAGGIDIIYPKENSDLYARLKSEGLLISEMPLGSKPQARHFPNRNRIISGLSEGVLVLEAALKSGSLITARFANEQGREVFAVPGSPMDARSRGCNDLIRHGATITETPDDILDILQTQKLNLSESANHGAFEIPLDQVPDCDLNKWRDKLLDALSAEPVSIDDLIRDLDAPASDIICLIMELEIIGQLYRHSGNKIAKTSNAIPF